MTPPVDWDTLRMGDSEPPDDGVPLCCALDSVRLYLCTRSADHGGRQHVAVAAGVGVVAVWPVDGAR